MHRIDIAYKDFVKLQKAAFNEPADLDSKEYEEFLPEMKSFIKKHQWTFAKSMPKNPHYYVCKDRLQSEDDREEFSNVVRFIQKYGYDEPFWKTTIRYLEVGLYKYWTMGYHWDMTIIINRALIGDK